MVCFVVQYLCLLDSVMCVQCMFLFIAIELCFCAIILVVYSSHFCLFFFFKQKTAYEMRISDWSSDGCSSDLVLDGSFLDGSFLGGGLSGSRLGDGFLGRRFLSGGLFSRGGGGFGFLGGTLLGALLGLLAGLALLRVAAGRAFHQAGLIEEAKDAVRRLSADRQPMLGAISVDLHALFAVAGKQRIVAADALDELAVARIARIGDDDLVVGTLLRATAREPDCNCHC